MPRIALSASVALLAIGFAAWHASEAKLVDMTERGRKLQASLPGGKREPQRRLLVLLWKPQELSGADKLRDRLLGTELPAGAAFSWYIEEDNASWSPNLATLSGPVSAALSLHLPELDDAGASDLVRKFQADGFGCAAYWVDYTVYTEYGEYGGPANTGWDVRRRRDWERGTRSPFQMVFTGFPAHTGISHDEFMRRWHGVQSPMSEIMQPRARYTRSAIVRAVTPNAPDFAGFVVEAWPSASHQRNPFLFFDAAGPWELLVNIAVMVRSVIRFSHLSKIQGCSVAEYIFE